MDNLQRYLLCLSEAIPLGFEHLSAFMSDFVSRGVGPRKVDASAWNENYLLPLTMSCTVQY
jgi:hypothetical protein